MNIDISKIKIEFEQDDRFWDFIAVFNKNNIGMALCETTNNGILEISDLKVSKDYPVSTVWSRSFGFLGFYPKRVDFRKKGIGSLLLKRVLYEAEKADINKVNGYVVKGDLKENPGLLAWYQQYGFKLFPPDPNGPPSAVNKIIKKLP